MKYTYILFSLLLAFNIHLKAAGLEDYYANATGKEGEALKSALHDIIKVQTILSYAEVWEALKTTDQDPDNADHVILLYSGWSYPKNNNGGGTTQWNREHTWAKSMGNFGTSNGPGTDIHHLRPTDVTVNSARGNLYFDNGGSIYIDATVYGGGDGTTSCKKDGDSWEPRDEVKGDVARMLFYMATRYELEDGVDLELAEYSSASGLHGKLSVLLQWHKDDPVDEWEIGRNERIYTIQNNRNPFIDHPEYVDLIWNSSNSGGGNNGGSTDEFTDVFFEDFENGSLGQMTSYNSIGSAQEWYYSSYSGTNFAKMSGYDSGSNYHNEDWLINKDAIRLNTSSTLYLSFISMMKVYTGETTLKVYISDEYDGTSNPNSFQWTELTQATTLSTGNYASVNSGDIDISAWFNKSVYVAFKFECSATSSDTWEIDDVRIKSKTTTSIQPNAQQYNIRIFPNPSKDKITIVSERFTEAKELKIISQTGQIISTIQNYPFNTQISVQSMQSGLYFVQITDEDNQSITKKIIIQ